MSTVDLRNAQWRKSSRSGNQGTNGNCVQVAFVNADWRKSSRSGNAGANGACVEIAYAGPAAAIRDSKNTSGPVLVFPAASFGAFLRSVG